MPTLRDIQDAFQAAILAGDDAILAHVTDSSRTSRTVLFGVYRNAYVGRLIDVLRSEYPVTAHYAGDAAFEAMARSYIGANPSRTQNARWFGSRLPEHLSTDRDKGPVLADLCQLERALSDAFDAPDACVLGREALAAVAPDDWPRLAFVLHPSVSLLTLASNAFEIWKAVNDKAAPPPAVEFAPREHVLVWRQGTTSKVRAISEDEWMALREASHGRNFAEICGLLAQSGDAESAPLRAIGLLQGWIAGEVLSAVAIAEEGTRVATVVT